MRIVILILIGLIGFIPLIKSQCKTEVIYLSNHKYFANPRERIWEDIGKNNNGDYSEGAKVFTGRIIAVGDNKESWTLEVGTMFIGRARPSEVIPKSIQLVFQDNSSIYLSSYNCNSEYVSDGTARANYCNFELLGENLKKFSLPIKRIVISDSYKSFEINNSINQVLKNHYECLNR